MKRKIYLILIFISSFLIFFDIYLFFHGSFEKFPSTEQNEKIKIISGIVLIILLVIEVILLKIYKLRK